MTNEELFLLKELQTHLGGDAIALDVVPRPQPADHLLVCGNKNPNSNGAKLLGVSQEGSQLVLLKQGIESGKYRVVLALHEELTELGILQEALKQISKLAVISLLPNTTTQAAHFLMPGAGFAEKRGSMINIKGRLQRLNKAIAKPGKAKEDWEILNGLLKKLGATSYLSIEEVFRAMAQKHSAFANLSLSKIGDIGVQLSL